jgi:sugar phosphate isomerase/epimerase
MNLHPCRNDGPHLTYCLNVHPGESWEENLAAIQAHGLRVREQVCPDRPFGLGLRLSNAASLALAVPAALQAFKSFLSAHNMYVFTINGFPYGAFHRTRVKEMVYQPDWRTVERVAYTRRLADILAELLPDGVEGSISTAPGSYKAWINSDADRRALARNLHAVAGHLADIYSRIGKRIHLGLEPEPDCYLETTAESIAFFEAHLLRGAQAESARRHIGICLDTCHLALQFEDLACSVQRFERHGILISKIQLSGAPACVSEQAAPPELAQFRDPVYLHQVRVRDPDGAIHAWPDLPEALAAGAVPGSEWRVHFHVPLDFAGQGALRSTSDQLTPRFFDAARANGVPHLEIETYTFDVLPAAMRARGVEASIAAEYAWALERLMPGAQPDCERTRSGRHADRWTNALHSRL